MCCASCMLVYGKSFSKCQAVAVHPVLTIIKIGLHQVCITGCITHLDDNAG